MSCVIVNAFDMSMATTQLTRVSQCEAWWPSIERLAAEEKPLRMNWVVVTDQRGKRQLLTNWTQSGTRP